MQFGDLIKVVKKNKEVITGTFVPSTQKDVLILKLDSGYQMGIDKRNLKKVSVLRRYKETRADKHKIKDKEGLPTISILHTGGTLASKVSYETGGVTARFEPEELLSMFPELKEVANIRSRLIRNMWSDDLRFEHFALIAKEIEKELKAGSQGIIVGIGTDNLSVASAALSFIIEETPKPIVFVGSQRSSDRGSSDAVMNLACAARFIANSDFGGIAICMHANPDDVICNILNPCKTAKLHTSRRDAFKPVNDIPIATVNYSSGKIDFNKKDYQKKDAGKKFIIKPKMERKTGLLKITVNMSAKQFEFFKGYKGLVIEGTGLGHIPGEVVDSYTKEHAKIIRAIKSLIKSGCIIIMTSQCLFGRVDMNVYSKGRELQRLGVISGEDMLPNTALVKLAWLLGNYKKDKVMKLIKENLRNEFNDRILLDPFI